MADNIRLQDFSSIYSQGLKPFIEDFLKEKAVSGESLVYSVEGRIIELEASDVLWIYTKLSQGPDQWEIDYLKSLAQKGEDITYDFNNQEVSVPASAVLDLLDNINKLG